jgi:hypothetical protein
MEDTAPGILTSALDEGEWSASPFGLFNPEIEAPGAPWIEQWVLFNYRHGYYETVTDPSSGILL